MLLIKKQYFLISPQSNVADSSSSANSIMHAMSCPVFNQMNSYSKIILKNDNAYLLTKNASYYEQLAVRWR